MKIYLKFLEIHFKSQLQYKISFFLIILSQFINTFFDFLGLQFLFSNFYNFKDFNRSEVILCFAIILLAFSIANFISTGLSEFEYTISNGDFDRILLRPKGTLLLVLSSKLDFSQIGSVIQSTLILIYAFFVCEFAWSFDKIFLVFSMIISGVFIFLNLFILYASLCFFTIQGLGVINIFTYGGVEFGKYPISIYGKNVLKFFTYVVPIALVQYYPLLYLTEKDQSLINFFSPSISFLFCIPILYFWKLGIKNYKSVGA